MLNPAPTRTERGVPPDPASIGSILVRVNNWIGDVVMISPAMRALRERFPNARITILAKPWVLEALRGSPFFDSLLPYEKDGRHAGIAGFLRLARELRRKKFDCAVLFQKAFEAALLATLARIPLRVGLNTDARGPLLTHRVPFQGDDSSVHTVEVFQEIVRALGCQIRDESTQFPADPEEFSWAAENLRWPGSPTTPLVAFHVGASKRPRAWHADRFAAVASRLQKEEQAGILLIGNRQEADLLDRIAGQLERPPVSIPEPRTLKRIAACLAHCRLFIGNDSGPMHIAAALGVPVIGLFGPSHAGVTGPFRPRGGFHPVTAGYPCAPCRQRFFRECDPSPSGKPPCMEILTVEEVLRSAREFLRVASPEYS